MALGGYVDTDAYAARVFRAGRGHTGGRLETDQDIMPESARRYRDDWLAAQSDPHESSIPVLGAGLRYATDSINPKDAQWIESRGYNSAEIARLFGVPPRYLGLPSGDSVTYATARDNDAAWIRTSLAPYIAEIESALSMLLPFGRTDSEDQRAVLNTESLLRSTTEDRWSAYSLGLSAGFLTVDEVRRSEGLPPLTDVPADAEPVSPGVIA
jgi:HK97 family phage portal protein